MISTSTHGFQLWLDTLDATLITQAHQMGILQGVTTNPSILYKANVLPHEVVESVAPLLNGPLAIQVTATDSAAMIKEAQLLYQMNSRIIVKIPCVQEGYQAMLALKQEQIPVLAIAIYSFRQLVMAINCGAFYVAPYFSRTLKYTQHIEQSAHEAAFQKTLGTFNEYNTYCKENARVLMAASIDSPETLEALIKRGIQCATVSGSVFKAWMQDHPKAIEDLNQFALDWGQLIVMKSK